MSGEVESTRAVAEVELVLKSDLLLPSSISQTTGLECSRAWAKGEEYLSKSGRLLTRHTGLWAISRRSLSVEEAAEELLTQIEPRIREIREAAGKVSAQIGVAIWWNPPGGQGGFGCSSVILRRLCDLTDRIELYFPG